MQTRRVVFLITIIIALLVTGCAAKTAEQSVERVKNDSAGGRAASGVFYGEAPAPEAVPAAEGATEAGADEARMIVQTVNLSIVVEDTDATLERVRQVAEQYEGYISQSNRWISDEQVYANVTLRVPAESLDAVRAALRGEALRVDNESTSGQDVTEEYVDLGARLRNLEATETELLALLTEMRENRGKAEDILAVYRELTDIRSQIESLKGRMQYLERSAALATIQLNIQPKAAPRQVIQPAKWSPSVTIANALRGFVNVLKVFVDLLIYVLIFSPFVLVPILVIWLLVRWLRRRKARKG